MKKEKDEGKIYVSTYYRPSASNVRSNRYCGYDIIADGWLPLRRTWGKNRPHPIAEKIVVHYLDRTIKMLWLVVPVVAFLYFYYFTVNPNYPVVNPIAYAFIVGVGFFILSLIFYFPLLWLFGYRVPSDKELGVEPGVGRRNSSVRSRSRSTSYSDLNADTHSGCDINPASGLPMIGGCGGLDVQGNSYGTDFHNDDFSSGLGSNDSFSDNSFGDI